MPDTHCALGPLCCLRSLRRRLGTSWLKRNADGAGARSIRDLHAPSQCASLGPDTELRSRLRQFLCGKRCSRTAQQSQSCFAFGHRQAGGLRLHQHDWSRPAQIPGSKRPRRWQSFLQQSFVARQGLIATLPLQRRHCFMTGRASTVVLRAHLCHLLEQLQLCSAGFLHFCDRCVREEGYGFHAQQGCSTCASVNVCTEDFVDLATRSCILPNHRLQRLLAVVQTSKGKAISIPSPVRLLIGMDAQSKLAVRRADLLLIKRRLNLEHLETGTCGEDATSLIQTIHAAVDQPILHDAICFANALKLGSFFEGASASQYIGWRALLRQQDCAHVTDASNDDPLPQH
mmetsp:Transcript_61478/g.143982  ORF Transcript_61478/g.143982 Transcript_61478/m.143982 type:complete len:344 (-) Transcript_61478:108-1139(-)